MYDVKEQPCLQFFADCEDNTKPLQEKLDPIKIPVSVGGGLGICRMAAMDMSHAIISVDHRSVTPTDDEVELINCLLDYDLMYYYDHYREKLLSKKYVMDSGANTVVLRKFGPDLWAYRRISWEYGPYMMPPEGAPLEAVLDRINDLVKEKWSQHKKEWFEKKG